MTLDDRSKRWPLARVLLMPKRDGRPHLECLAAEPSPSHVALIAFIAVAVLLAFASAF